MSVPRPTEMTVRSLLLKELERRRVKVNPEIVFLTPAGRMMPDAVLQNGGDYVVETKLGVEAKLLDAMVRLHDYYKYTEARGAFAILFPEQLRRPWPYEMLERIAADSTLPYTVTAIFRDLRPSQRFTGNLTQIADWIAEQVLKPPVVEADTSFAIRVLSDAVDYITASTRQLGGKELEDIFGGRTVFENILQYEEGRYPLEEMRKAAIYLLINQILFYHVLSSVDRRYPAIDETKIKRPGDLAGYFRVVLERDYTSTFGFDVASRLPVDVTEMVRNVIKVIGALAPQKIRHDVLGKVFHELIPFEIRKAVAAFYTNNEAAEILAQLAIDDPNAKVIDLAVGSGTLLVTPYRRKRELLLKTKGTFTLEDHKRFLEEDLTGIDVMPFAAHLAVVHLSLQALLYEYETERVRIAVRDSTELKPGQTISAISKELITAYRRPTLDIFMQEPEEAYKRKNALAPERTEREEIYLEQGDVVIMNPPFTRQERLPKEYKVALTKRFQEYEKCLHGQLGLYGYFIFLADRFAKTGGRIALVLPATVLRVKSAEGVRRLLAGNYYIELEITAYERAAFSEGAQFREILLIAKKLKGSGELKCGITSLKTLPRSIEEAKEYAQKIRLMTQNLKGGEVYSDDTMIIRTVTQDELKKHVENMYVLISTYDLKVPSVLEQTAEKASTQLVIFENYIKKVRGEIFRFDYDPPYHGTFLVQPVRAIKKVDEWVVGSVSDADIIIENRFTKEKLKVPLKALERGLRRPARTDKMDLTDELDYVITAEFGKVENVLKRPPIVEEWKNYVKPRLANLIVSRRFDISAPGTKLIAYYSSTPMVGVDMWSIKGVPDEDAKILALWLNSTVNLLSTLVNRTETRGAWMKIHEYTMKKSLMLDPNVISQSDRTILLDMFDRIRDRPFPGLLQQLKSRFSMRVEMDRAILKVLGFNEDEITHILDYLYPALANEIEKLKTLMAG